MPKMYILRGLPGSGKSTLAKELGGKRINFDLLREMLDFKAHSRANEKFLHKVARAIAKTAYDEGYDIVMDNLNLSQSQTSLNSGIAAMGFETKTVDLPATVYDCIERDSKRGEKSVGRKVILDLWNKYLRPQWADAPVHKDTQNAIIVDLDGTMSEFTNRGPFEYDKIPYDKWRDPIFSAVAALEEKKAAKIIAITGRPEKARKDTTDFLDQRFFAYDLYMRDDADYRSGDIVKKELFYKHVFGKYNVIAIFEDMEKVCRMWDNIGFGKVLFRVGRVDGDDL